MKSRKKEAERKVYVTIRSPAGKNKPVKLESWRYWEIVGELRDMGLDRTSAYDAAGWIARAAKPGDARVLPGGISLVISRDGDL